jgi:hypothetical protein
VTQAEIDETIKRIQDLREKAAQIRSDILDVLAA